MRRMGAVQSLPRRRHGRQSSSSVRRRMLTWSWTVLLLLCGTIEPVHAGVDDADLGYGATTDVTKALNLALDLRDMRVASGKDAARAIYEKGKNVDGMSLQSLSLDSNSTFSNFPLYRVYQHAFVSLGLYMEEEHAGYFDGAPAAYYANTLVDDLFNLNIDRIEADGALILNVLMSVWGNIWKVYETCQAGKGDQKTDLLAYLDTAAAFWVGAEQEEDDNESGHALYNMAEMAGAKFLQDKGETLVNTNMLTAFRSIKQQISTGQCSNDTNLQTVRQLAQSVIHVSNIMLMQMLLHHVHNVLNENGSDYVELFSLALLPQIAACDTDRYQELLELTVTRDVTSDTQETVIKALQASYSCLGITCSEVGSYQGGVIQACQEKGVVNLAGYTPLSNVQGISHVDRDIKQIQALMELGSFTPALDIYQNGWNAPVSLRQLATNAFSGGDQHSAIAESEFDNFKNYFQTSNYSFVDGSVVNALQKKSPFGNATDDQRVSLVTASLSGTTMYLATIGYLDAAVAACSVQDKNATLLWDSGVATLIGSTEGTTSSGQEGGESLFGLAKVFCDRFDVCEPHNAVVNEEVMSSLTAGRSSLKTGLCQPARSALNNQIKPLLLVPLIQGYLLAASESASTASSASVGAMYAYSRAILPAIAAQDSDSASTITANAAFNGQPPVYDGIDAIFSAAQVALAQMSTKCADIGTLTVTDGHMLNVCGYATISSFQPATDVAEIMMLSRDVQDMKNAGDDISQKMTIYENGFNGADGVTLASLSLNATKSMYPSLMYSIYKAGFADIGQSHEGDAPGKFDGAPVSQYADTLLRDLFELKVSGIEAEGVVALSFAMAFWSELDQMLNECLNQSYDGARSALDAAAAYYYGDRLTSTSSRLGYAIYDLADFAATQFSQSEGGARINRLVGESFALLQSDLEQGQCSNGDAGYASVRNKAKNLVQYVSTVLIQMLIHHVESVETEGETDFVELYALSVLPQISVCDFDTYTSLVRLSIDNFVTPDSKVAVLELIEGSLTCLGLSCTAVGGYQGQNACDKDPALATTKLAGYEAGPDALRMAFIDRDIKLLGILADYNAYSKAMDVYRFGWSTDFSVQDLAEANLPDTTNATLANFTTYFSWSPDNLILEILTNAEPYNSLTDTQRAASLKGALQGIVMFLSVLAQLSDAIQACATSDSDSARMHWDNGVALFVGSIEGQESGGQKGGTSLFGLGKSNCDEFGTCSKGDALVNTKLMQSLTVGREALKTNECEVVHDTLSAAIGPLLLVPLVQSTLLHTAISVSQDDSVSVGFMHSFSRAVIPSVAAADTETAQTIDRNTKLVPGNHVVPDGGNAVFVAFHDALQEMATSCEDIGVLTSGNVQGNLQRGVCDDSYLGGSPSPGTAPITPYPVATPTTDSPIYVPKLHPDGLAWGRYDFVNESVAFNAAQFSLDVKDMYYATNSSRARQIYEDGSNSAGALWSAPFFSSLSTFSTQASLYMKDDPLYSFYRAAFYEDDSFEGAIANSTWAFGDAVVNLALSPGNGDDPRLAAEAAVVMNVFMVLAHELSESVRQCQAQSDTAVAYIDTAVGFWIGMEQGESVYDSGWFLYAIAQDAAKLYGVAEGESKVNTMLMDAFNKAQGIAQRCPTQDGAWLQLRIVVTEVVRLLSIPLLQQLLYHMSQGHYNEIELYALAFIPQAVSCNSAQYDYLRDSLFEGFADTAAQNARLFDGLSAVMSCLRITCDDIGDTTAAGDRLQNTVSSVCTELDTQYSPSLLAAYETTSDVKELARIDLDINQILLFMQTGSYALAKQYYEFGQNSIVTQSKAFSLQDLARDENRTGSVFKLFGSYYQSDDFADEVISQALNRTGLLESASRLQLREAVFRALQSLVLFVQVTSRLQNSLDKCAAKNTSSTLESAAYDIDAAAALFVGSIEGSRSGGSPTNSGRLLMALGKEYCSEFGKCETHGDATINEYVMFAFADVKQWIVAGDCESAQKVVDESISPLLPVPLLQATLYNAYINQNLTAQSAAASVATGAFVADGILPLMAAVNKTSTAVVYRNMDFNLNQQPVLDGFGDVASAIASTVRGMGVDCDYVGTMLDGKYSLCGTDDGMSPPPSTTTNLGDNLYVSSTYVQDIADIAQDVRQIEDALRSGKRDLAQLIYSEGENSPIFDARGRAVGDRSLGRFSTNASSTMLDNPLYYLAIYTLANDKGLYLGKSASQYADSIVQEAFARGGISTLPAEAAVALNLWLEMSNELFEILSRCKNNAVLDKDGIHSIDQAVAYWIGDGQIAGDPVRGHLLYAISERFADLFGTQDPTGQSRNNVNILRLFHEAKIELAYPDACGKNPATVGRLRHIVNQIVSQMMVVNVQGLIHNLYVNDMQRVRVYAHGVVPFVASCNPDTFSYLRDKLLTGSYAQTEVDTLIESLQSLYPCLGIQCDDIGIHQQETASTCDNVLPSSAMAGYRPATDVREYSQLDLDVLELDILLQMNARGPAEELYSYGKHAASGSPHDQISLSLGYLATAAARFSAPEFDSYQSYFDNDAKYADTMIRKALQQSSTTSKDDFDQRRVIILTVSQYMIPHMSILEFMANAITACEGGDDDDSVYNALQFWERGVALVTGHLEGASPGGSDDGRFLWALAKQECRQFGTCSAAVPGSADVNDRLKSMFYTGRGAIQSGSCDVLRKTVLETKGLLLVPILQSLFGSLTEIAISRHRSDQRTMERHAKTYVLAQTILPLIADIDADKAALIDDQLDFANEPLPDGIQPVAGAIIDVLEQLGVDCTDLGSTASLDACSGRVHEKTSRVGVIVGVLVGSLAMMGIVIMLRAHQRRWCDKSGNAPTFVRSTRGELNHVSDGGITMAHPPECAPGSDHGDKEGLTETAHLKDDDDDSDEYEDANSPSDDEDAYMNSVLRRLEDQDGIIDLQVV